MLSGQRATVWEEGRALSADHQWGWEETAHSACISHSVCEFVHQQVTSALSFQPGWEGV